MNLANGKLFSRITKLIIYIFVFWLVFLLVRSVWQNWSLKNSLQKLNEQIAALEKEKANLENLIVYYRSDSFKELEARRKLNLKKPGEKMVIIISTPAAIPISSPTNFTEELKKEQEKITSPLPRAQIPTWLLWWEYFTR